MYKSIYILIHIFITVVFVAFLLAAFGLLFGSLEILPTAEQQGKAQIGYSVIILFTILLEIALVIGRYKLKHKTNTRSLFAELRTEKEV